MNRRDAFLSTTAVTVSALGGALAAGRASAAAETQPAASPVVAPALAFPLVLPQPTVPIFGSVEVFPVHRIYCIGRNFAAHAREMGSDPAREPPFFFQKPNDAVQFIAPGIETPHRFPTLTQNYHHEVELVAALHSGGWNIPVEQALNHVYGYSLGLDMTRRDLQNDMKKQGKPWEIGKSFDHSAPIGPIHRAAQFGHFTKGQISLAVNGKVRQQADLSEMIWSVAEQISHLSQAFELQAGDLIYCGTPENVGPVVRGDLMLARLEGLPDLKLRIV